MKKYFAKSLVTVYKVDGYHAELLQFWLKFDVVRKQFSQVLAIIVIVSVDVIQEVNKPIALAWMALYSSFIIAVSH